MCEILSKISIKTLEQYVKCISSQQENNNLLYGVVLACFVIGSDSLNAKKAGQNGTKYSRVE